MQIFIVFWQAEWNGINNLRFFNRKTKKNELTAALALINDAGTCKNLILLKANPEVRESNPSITPKTTDKVIEIIKNDRVNKEQLYNLLINQLQSASFDSGELEKNIILHFLYVATGAFDKAIEILDTIKKDIKGSLLNIQISSIISIKSDFITEYKNRLESKYPALTISDYLPFPPTSPPVPDDITISELYWQKNQW